MTTTKNNKMKTNLIFNYEKFYTQYIECKTKREIVSVCTENGVYTTTKPTDTINSNDLYIQFFDKSRLKLNKTSLQIYTCNEIALELEQVFECKSDNVSDGAYRTNRLILNKSVNTIKKLFEYFSKKTLLYSTQLPVTEPTVVVEK